MKWRKEVGESNVPQKIKSTSNVVQITPGDEKTAADYEQRDDFTAWNGMMCNRNCCGGTRHAVYKSMGHVIYTR